MLKAMSIEVWLRTNGIDLVRVLYGLEAPGSNVITELSELVDDGSRRRISIYTLNDRLELVRQSNQLPPFKTDGELAYDLFKCSEIAAWWLINPAISTVYGFSGFVAGDRKCIALLAQLSDMVGRGAYRGHQLTSDLSVVEADLKRYGVVGLFYNPQQADLEEFVKLATNSDPHHRYVALWALSNMSNAPQFAPKVQSALRSAAKDPSPNVREFAQKALSSSRENVTHVRISNTKGGEPQEPLGSLQRLRNTQAAAKGQGENDGGSKHLTISGPVDIPAPHPGADPERAARLNIQYQDQVRKWRSLPWWKRLTIKPPEPPERI